MKKSILIVFIACTMWCADTSAQCCGGGSGSPISGEALKGILLLKQFEVNSNFQMVNTNKFLKGETPDTNYLDRFYTNYLYTRLGYGLTKNLTLSVESGYWLNKTQIGLHKIDTNSSKGIGDLILFPRYNVYKHRTATGETEITVGLGFKIPLGKYNDSTRKVEPFSGMVYYITKPLAVQTSSGAQDIIFYLFFLRGYPVSKFNFFCNALYIKKGWNPLGEKIGDFASISLYASKSVLKNMTTTLQLKGEWVDQMKLNKNILLYAYPNYDPFATGYKKLFLVPQLSYSLNGRYSFYASAEIPVYQKMTKIQIASQYQFAIGASYRFFISKDKTNDPPTCENNLTDLAVNSTDVLTKDSMKVSGRCGMCKDRIETTAKNIRGVKDAGWDSTTQMLVYTYKGTVVKNDVSSAMNAVGHDTEISRAPDKKYNKLPACCRYR